MILEQGLDAPPRLRQSVEVDVGPRTLRPGDSAPRRAHFALGPAERMVTVPPRPDAGRGHAGVRTDLATVRAGLIKWMFMFWAGNVVATASLVLGAVILLRR